MNTHSDGLYGTLSTLYKRKTLVRLESATPAVDRPVAKVELMQVREVMLGCLSRQMAARKPRSVVVLSKKCKVWAVDKCSKSIRIQLLTPKL